MRGQRLTQIMAGRVAILPDLAIRLLHCGNRPGGGAKDILIRSQTRGKGSAAVAFLLFGADEGNACGQALYKSGISGSGHFFR